MASPSPSSRPPSARPHPTSSPSPLTVTSVFLPAVQLHDLPDDVRAETCIFLTKAASSPVTELVVDHFSTAAFDVPRELAIRPYVFFPSNTYNLSDFLRFVLANPTIGGFVSHCGWNSTMGSVPWWPGRSTPSRGRTR